MSGAPRGATGATGAADSVAEVVGLFERFGNEHYDEELSQLDHALQTAARARAEGADDALVAAALLHDVGHLLHLAAGGSPTDGADLHHEDVGARWLAPLLPPAVTAPIALHVRAKRFLAATEPGYAALLSPASVRSLRHQGGPLTPAEVAAFRANPGAEAAVALRRWDEAGKVDGLSVDPLAGYVTLLERLATRPG